MKKIINSAYDIVFPEPYIVQNNCLCFVSSSGGKETVNILCNFVPYIVKEISSFDGYEHHTKVEIAGFDSFGNALPNVIVSNEEFDKMNWIRENWGFGCNISTGQSVKDRIRFAIQSTSNNANKESVFTTTGWYKLDGKYVFLMPGDEQINVSLEGKLSGYGFERKELSEKEYAAVYMMISSLKNFETIQMLLSFVFLSPLNHFLRLAQHEPKTAIMLYGKTGSKKSTLAALMCSFFGKFSTTDLPLSFRDTANSIIFNSSTLKDVLTVVDDFHPSLKNDEGSMTKNMQQLLRAYGNRCGRARLNSFARPTETRYPKGNAIFTAEFLPDVGESGTARYIPLELKPDSINNEMLSFYQQLALDGVLSSCMFHYTEWIKEKYLDDEQSFIKLLGEKFETNRRIISNLFTEKKMSIRDRLVDDFVCFRIGFEFMLKFYEDKIHTEECTDNLLKQFDNFIILLAEKREKLTCDDAPTHKFICKLFALLDSGRITLVNTNETFPEIKINNVGYEDDKFFYLHSAAVHKEVRRLCDEQGESFTINEKALIKALADENLIELGNDGRNTVQHKFGGKNKRYLVLNKQKARTIYDKSA